VNFFIFYSFLYDNVYELWQVLDPNDLCCMLCICPKTTRSVSCCHFHRPVHPLSITVCGHAHSLYSGIQSQNSSMIFFRRTFHHDISIASKHLFMSIVMSTCHWVFSYEVVNVIIFQCISLFFPFPVPIQCRHRSHQWIPVMLCTCKCDEKSWGSQLSDHCKYSFLVLLQVVRRDANVFEIYVSNIRF
jgi:hypothetical protein